MFFIRENVLFFLHGKVKNAGDDFSNDHTDTEGNDDKEQSLPKVKRQHNNARLDEMHASYPINELLKISRNYRYQERSNQMKSSNKYSHAEGKFFGIDHERKLEDKNN